MLIIVTVRYQFGYPNLSWSTFMCMDVLLKRKKKKKKVS